jgi:hypothetical protein
MRGPKKKKIGQSGDDHTGKSKKERKSPKWQESTTNYNR